MDQMGEKRFSCYHPRMGQVEIKMIIQYDHKRVLVMILFKNSACVYYSNEDFVLSGRLIGRWK